MRGMVPPYGPASGMLQAIQLFRKEVPQRVDGDYLRKHGIAPGNEYKVVGALRYLGLIDEDGRPTEKTKLLRARGSTFMMALQEIVRDAYRDLFSHLSKLRNFSKDEIYNYFVIEENLGPEMANKATRFFIHLCRLCGIDLGIEVRRGRSEGKRRNARRNGGVNLSIALTPEILEMDVDKLSQVIKKLYEALDRAFR